jgi:hypothetical protein
VTPFFVAGLVLVFVVKGVIVEIVKSCSESIFVFPPAASLPRSCSCVHGLGIFVPRGHHRRSALAFKLIVLFLLLLLFFVTVFSRSVREREREM